MIPVAAAPGAWELAANIKANWRAGAPPSAVAALAEYPGLSLQRSVVIDLAYEEFLLREKNGAAPDPCQFARQFPDFQASVQDMLDVHCKLLANPGLLDSPAPEWPEVGSVLEGLELRSELGRGAFGRAYLAYDPAIHRLRALKLTPGGSAEAQVIGRLSHDHIIDICWARQVGRRTAVCMPFVGACTLADVIFAAGRKPKSAQVILDAAETTDADFPANSRSKSIVRSADPFLVGASALAAGIAAAVDYLHRSGIVHGDLKPSNVVVEPGGSPRLIDFNLAAGEESPTALRGTPAYMAPELLDGTLSGANPAQFDGPKADLFALGVVVAELLTGRHPYRSLGNGTIASLAAAARKPLQFPPNIPTKVAQALKALLAPNPADRPDSAAELTRELDRVVVRSRTRSRRLRRYAAGAASLLLVAGLAPLVIANRPVPETVAVEVPERQPETAAEFHDRGLKLLHENRVAEAMPFLLDAVSRSNDPQYKAMAAYGFLVNGQMRSGIEMSRMAIEQGAGTAEVYNNLGLAQMRTGAFPEAVAAFSRAIELSPDLKVARYNRAMALYQSALKRGKAPIDARAIADMKMALEGPAVSGRVHLDAARVYSLAKLKEEGFTQLELAARAGIDPNVCLKDPILASYRSHPRFAELFKLPAASDRPVSTPRLMEPRF